MEHSKKRVIITTIVGGSLFAIGLILLLIGLNIKRPVVTYYDTDGTTVISTEKVALGSSGGVNYIPQKECETKGYVYVFKGWKVEYTNELVQFIEVTEDKPYKAVATYDKVLYSYEISYDLKSGAFPSNVTPLYKYNVNDSYEFPTPIKNGYDFVGWYNSNKLITKIEKGTAKDFKLVAKWTPHTYSIKYDVNGGVSVSNPTEYTIESDTFVLTSPTKENFTFAGWYNAEGTLLNVIQKGSTGDLELIAKWVKTINYNLDGGSNSYSAPKTYELGTTLELVDPTKFGYVFCGWYDNAEFKGEKISSISYEEVISIDLYAKWEKTTDNLIFEENGLQYIYFGKYPQTVVTDYNIIKELEKLCENQTSCVYEGEEYVKLEATPSVFAKFNNPVEKMLNDTLSSTNEITSKTTYYFKVEPIKWRVLSTNDGKVQLLCEYALDVNTFGKEQIINGQKSYANNYENSIIRTWLNNEFYNTAFSTDEKTYINITEVDNSSLSTSSKSDNKYASHNTLDCVYLLSYKQATSVKNGFITSSDEQDEKKACLTTDYARAKGAVINLSDEYFGYANWMLRSPFDNDQNGISVVVGIENGTNQVNTVALWYDCTSKLAVRPAITITLE